MSIKAFLVDGAAERYDYNALDNIPDIPSGGGGGTPIVVTEASKMTDKEAAYVYMGNEAGWNYGHWYYWNGSEWADSGQYAVGQDGFSPTITATQTSTGATITITDKTGTSTVSLINGTATDAQVADWLDAHPEATTTVQDGAITNPKLADKAVSMDKTNFYYTENAIFSADWFTKGLKSSTIPSVIIADNLATVTTANEEMPDVFSIVAVASDYWSTGKTCRLRTRTSGYTYTNFNIVHSTKTIVVGGETYGVLYFTKDAFNAAYESMLADINDNGKLCGGAQIQLGNAAGSFTGTYWVVSGEVTAELIELNFNQTVISADFVTAVQAAMESGDGGLSYKEQLAKSRLTGKVMVCLGDSYTKGMEDQLAALGTKYGMIVDNRGIVSSSVAGTWSASTGGGTGYRPMWRRAKDIVSEYTEGKTISGTTYTVDDVAIITFMGGANDGFGVSTWIGSGINDTDTAHIYGACNSIFNDLLTAFPNAKMMCVLQPSNYNRETSSVDSDAGAQAVGFDSLAQLQAMTNIQFSNYAMAQKETAVQKTAWAYGLPIVDMFNSFPTVFQSTNRSTYWSSDKLHLTATGYQLITNAIDKKIVELVVG